MWVLVWVSGLVSLHSRRGGELLESILSPSKIDAKTKIDVRLGSFLFQTHYSHLISASSGHKEIALKYYV